jgi:chromosome segregation ATPase
LAAKVATLEARLDEKKGALLERELVLEEVTTLTQKLKNRAGEGREGTLKLTAQVNLYQTKIRDVTRRMMATVSELSMYQATAMKLQQEKNARAAALEEAKWKVAHGQPPSEAAEREWYHAEQQALSKAEARLMSRTAGANGGGAAAAAVRTTAEPRPNAYIPDELGIPKPYGTLAPFKPTEAGATMRHIRNPNPAEIEI